MNKRKRIPKTTETAILTKSRRRCAICFGLQGDLSTKKGQIAHLDGNRANSMEDNLSFLCLDHHDEYDSKTSQSKGLTEQEVKVYRENLYQEVVHLAIETNTHSLAQVMPQIDELKRIISEVVYCLDHYARWYGMLGSGHLKDMKKAYEALQQCAHRLVACAQALEYPIDKSYVEEARALLIGISNTIIGGDILYMQQNSEYVPDSEEIKARRMQSRENRQNAERVKRLLEKIPSQTQIEQPSESC